MLLVAVALEIRQVRAGTYSTAAKTQAAHSTASVERVVWWRADTTNMHLGKTRGHPRPTTKQQANEPIATCTITRRTGLLKACSLETRGPRVPWPKTNPAWPRTETRPRAHKPHAQRAEPSRLRILSEGVLLGGPPEEASGGQKPDRPPTLPPKNKNQLCSHEH